MVVFRGTQVLVAGPSLQALGVASLADLVRLAKERPGKLF
jgi:hypothetical protein